MPTLVPELADTLRRAQRRGQDLRHDRLARRLDDRSGRRHQGRHQPAVALDVERGQRLPAGRARRGRRRPRRRGEMRDAFDRRRRTIHRMLNEIPGVELPRARGRVLRLPVVRRTCSAARSPVGDRTTTIELAEVILDEAKVAIVPGEAFGAPGYARLSFALGDDDLVEGIDRIAELLASATRLRSDAWRTRLRTVPGRRPITAELVVAGAVGLGDVPGRRRRRVVVRVPTRAGGPHRDRPPAARRRAPSRCSPTTSRPAPGSTSTAAAPGGCTTTPSSSRTGPISASTGSTPTPSPGGSRAEAADARTGRAHGRPLRRRRAHRRRPLGRLRARAPRRPATCRNELVAIEAQRRR